MINLAAFCFSCVKARPVAIIFLQNFPELPREKYVHSAYFEEERKPKNQEKASLHELP